ncbi:FtsK/SpoIIIE domain-containing protein [Burkholderia cenocepacia]|uniref:FtsK/SpoIIIE domain-containing protein n=1 Tax=Burkholderia cenocepacia TaxID=95486 RepID=UPI00158B4042|nr:FtsK/SpoIIIE domain-containing protein [Burkholderia cenocepacia]
MSSLYFTSEERDFCDRVLEQGMNMQPKHAPRWWVVRFAVSQSLRLDTLPDERYNAPTQRASELELEQITGVGKDPSENYDDAMRLLLSVRHQQDLFHEEGNSHYLQALQRHARRGIERMMSAWRPDRSFHDYLLDELYLDAGPSPDYEGSSTSGVVSLTALVQGLGQIGVSAEPVGEPLQGPRLTRFQLTLATVDDYDRLRKGTEDLAFAIGLGSVGIAVTREQGERRVIVDVPRPSASWTDVTWPGIRAALADRQEALPVCPGVDVMGTPLIFDLVDTPHLFIAGATGSGKSVCLNALLVSMLAARNPPELLMIDPKGVDFADYDQCARLRDRRVITDMSEAVAALRGLVHEMEARQGVLRQYNARNLAEAQASGASLERLVVIIDELADFMMGKSGAEEPLIRLAQKARATGIHLVLATQRPEAATFPGLLRANIPSRIALTVQKSADSRIILDEGGAEKLLMRGDMLVKLAGRDAVRAHGARVEPTDIRAVIQGVNRR